MLPASRLEFFGDYLLPLHQAHDHNTWILASDYGGDHQGATYRTYGFLLVCKASLARWWRTVAALRAEIGDAREFSYKEMRDAVRRRHLASFLSAADTLHGACLPLRSTRTVTTRCLEQARGRSLTGAKRTLGKQTS